jgi:hypothetical protein
LRTYLTNRRQKVEVKSPDTTKTFFSDWDTLKLGVLNTYKDPTSVRTSDDRSNSLVSSKLPNNWQTVTDKPRKSKKVNRTTHDQLLIPVIPITIAIMHSITYKMT